MITLRYRKIQSEKFSVYLDIRSKNDQGKSERSYEFLRIYVSKDYSLNNRIVKEDEQKMEFARSIASKRELELNGMVNGLTDNGKRVNRSILSYIENEKLREGREDYQYILQHLQRFYKGKDILFSDVTPKFLAGFSEYLEKGMSRNSVIKYLSNVKTFIGKAYRDDIITTNPFQKFEMPRSEDVERGYLTLAELKALNETPTYFEEHIRQGFLFSCFTGLRLSDILNLEYSQIKEEQNQNGETYFTLLLRPKKTSNTTGNLLQIPMSEQAILLFQSVKEKAITTTGKVFSRFPQSINCNYHIKKWAVDAGIKKNIHFHLARHSFATLSLTSGIDIYTVSKLLGHSNLQITQVYAKIIDEKKRDEIAKFPQFL
jgi:site-specific recombinase XerD